MSTLQLRLGTAAVLLTLVFAALAAQAWSLSEWPWRLLVAVGGLLALWEWSSLLQLRGIQRGAYVLGGILLAGALVASASGEIIEAWVLWSVTGLWALALLRIIAWAYNDTSDMLLLGIVGIGAIPLTCLILVSFSVSWILALLAVVIVADTAAYAVGRRYGRTPLAPEISPGKTRAGLVGALVTVAILSVPAAWLLGAPMAAWFYLSCLMVLTACFSVVGDLTESLLKRRASVKDSGTLLPGHGGVLDRIDGLLAAAPIFALGIHQLRRIVAL